MRIQNGGAQTVQLLTRHWMITDARGHVQEVRGTGVVGKQPVLRPGEAFEYASGTPLATPSGIMMGSYQMQAADTGEQFDIAIPAFSLDSPHIVLSPTDHAFALRTWNKPYDEAEAACGDQCPLIAGRPSRCSTSGRARNA